MRKLVAAMAFLAVTALPASALAQPHWRQGEEAQVTVYVERTQVGATNWSYLERPRAEWSRSRRIEVVFVKRCPSSYDCVKVYQGRSSRSMAAWTTLNYDPRTNTAWYGSLHLNTCYLASAAARRKTACHELGHVLGSSTAGPARPACATASTPCTATPTPPTTPTCVGSAPRPPC